MQPVMNVNFFLLENKKYKALLAKTFFMLQCCYWLYQYSDNKHFLVHVCLHPDRKADKSY